MRAAWDFDFFTIPNSSGELHCAAIQGHSIYSFDVFYQSRLTGEFNFGYLFRIAGFSHLLTHTIDEYYFDLGVSAITGAVNSAVILANSTPYFAGASDAFGS